MFYSPKTLAAYAALTLLIAALCGLLWLVAHLSGCEPYRGGRAIGITEPQPVEVERD